MSKVKPMHRYRWDVRTGSPRKLWRMMDDLLVDNGYAHKHGRELKPESGPIDGTATFHDVMAGWKDCDFPRNRWFFALGVLLCLTVVLIPLGRYFIRKSDRDFRAGFKLIFHGEVYRTREAGRIDMRAEEVVNVVADTRIELQAWVGKAISTSTHPVAIAVKREAHSVKWLEEECAKLKVQIDLLLNGPSVVEEIETSAVTVGSFANELVEVESTDKELAIW